MSISARNRGFTAVELMIVITLIVILTGVVSVIYLNASNSARSNALRSDLKAAASQLEAYRNFENTYPTTANQANGGKGLPKGDNTVYSYTYNAGTDTYCLAASWTDGGGVPTYFITDSATDAVEGSCP